MALLKVSEVARQLRVNDTTVRRWIADGVLEAVALPKRGKQQSYRVKQQTIDQLLERPDQSRHADLELPV